MGEKRETSKKEEVREERKEKRTQEKGGERILHFY